MKKTIILFLTLFVALGAIGASAAAQPNEDQGTPNGGEGQGFGQGNDHDGDQGNNDDHGNGNEECDDDDDNQCDDDDDEECDDDDDNQCDDDDDEECDEDNHDYHGTATIGDRVWNDSNANGIQDVGEQGIFNVTVNLWNGNETGPINLIATTKTDENGNYYFKNLIKGIYWLEFIAPTATDGTWIFSPQDQGTDNSIDSDPNASGIAGPINVNEYKCCPTWDAGLYFVSAAGGEEEEPTGEAAGGEEEVIEIVEVIPEEVAAAGEEVPLQETGVPILPGVLAALMIGGGLLGRKLRK